MDCLHEDRSPSAVVRGVQAACGFWHGERGMGQETSHTFCLNAEDRMYALCYFAYDAFGLVISSQCSSPV